MRKMNRFAQHGSAQRSPARGQSAYKRVALITGLNSVAFFARAIITLGDVRYPKKLLDTEDPPLMLYVVGARAVVQGQPFAEGRCLAVVGSRNPTAQGADNAYQFAKALGATGLTIVSGLALGVDAAAAAARRDRVQIPARLCPRNRGGVPSRRPCAARRSPRGP
mgnify:CR=1 FL=1